MWINEKKESSRIIQMNARLAHFNGKLQKDNPYPKGSRSFNIWNRAWKTAEKVSHLPIVQTALYSRDWPILP